jgi:hypothetical protein
MITCMKMKLTDCGECSIKKFRFGIVLFLFFFERVPSLSLREIVWEHVAYFSAVCRWETLLPQKGGGRTIEAFDDTFFDWWAWQILVIEDYPYAGINFSRDPDMLVPRRKERGEIGTCVFKVI